MVIVVEGIIRKAYAIKQGKCNYQSLASVIVVEGIIRNAFTINYETVITESMY